MIDSFRGPTRWLSNFEVCDVMYNGCIYPSSEHAYQAAKTFDHDERVAILRAPTPSQAKKLGQKVTLRSDWTPETRIRVMLEILTDKFTRNQYLKEKLIATGEEDLIEGNNWGDKFWGVCDGVGENNLGKVLMHIRSNLNENEGA